MAKFLFVVAHLLQQETVTYGHFWSIQKLVALSLPLPWLSMFKISGVFLTFFFSE